MLDHAGRVTAWSDDARNWSGYAAADALGRHCGFLIAQAVPGTSAAALCGPDRDEREVTVTLSDGARREAHLTCRPLDLPGGTTSLLCELGEAAAPPRAEVRAAFADALLRTSPFGLGVIDNDLRYVVVNDALAEFNGIPVHEHIGRRIGEVVRAADDGAYERHLRAILETGEPLHNVLIATRTQGHRDRDRAWSVSFFRLTGRGGRVLGLGGLVVDVTQKETALLDASAVRQRLALVNEAGSKVGTTLVMAETARELAEFVVPEFADAASVEIREDFLVGGRLRSSDKPVSTMRLAVRSVLDADADGSLFTDPGSEHVHPVGSLTHQTLVRDHAWLGETPAGSASDGGTPADSRPPGSTTADRTPGGGPGSLVTVPLVARGRCLGLVRFARDARRDPLDDDDLKVAEELAARTALNLDNARMYEEERRIAVALQRDMLPSDHDITGRPGLEVAAHYWSTSRSAKVGGDWFDVIPLSGHRVALVVGDMMGHDIQAAAGMGQLRTAMHTLARLDLEPVDLLTRLDDIVQNSAAMQHATCVYAVYNTVTRQCAIVNAGHPPPVLRHRDGTTEILPVATGVPLGIGLGASEFENVELRLPQDGTLVLYTDGLIERRGQDIECGIETLRAALTRAAEPALPVQQVCDDLVAALSDDTGDDDLAVLMARTPAIPHHHCARWQLPPVAASVPRVRALVRAALRDWGLEPFLETAELMVSEIVTNAVRYARGDLDIQLARGETLVLEVADDDERLPHLTPIAPDDEHGRGLTLVDAIAGSWGARSIASGKVVWCELPLPPAESARDGELHTPVSHPAPGSERPSSASRPAPDPEPPSSVRESGGEPPAEG